MSDRNALRAAQVEHPTYSANLAHNPALDHVRFLAAFLVFCDHAFPVYAKGVHEHMYLGLLTGGYTGVTLFFVLSGYLFMSIAMSSPSGAIDYRRFLANRFLRIYPMFLFMFFVAISIGQVKFVPQDILYLFFSNIGSAPTSYTAVTGTAWTISVEFTFYLVFPFLARFAIRSGPTYLLQALLLMLVVRLGAFAVAEHPTLMFYSTLVGRFDQFLIGMLAAQLLSRVPPRQARMMLIVGTVLIFFFVGLQTRYAPLNNDARERLWVVWGEIEAACWALVVAGYARANIKLPAVLARWLERGGELSYSLYLLHVMVLTIVVHYVGTLFPHAGSAITFLVNGAIVLALAWGLASLTFRIIEQPFLKMRSKYIGATPVQHVAPRLS